MAVYRSEREHDQLEDLLKRDHTLNGGILFRLDGYIIEIQARAVQVLNGPVPWRAATTISGMPRAAVYDLADSDLLEALEACCVTSRTRDLETWRDSLSTATIVGSAKPSATLQSQLALQANRGLVRTMHSPMAFELGAACANLQRPPGMALFSIALA